MSFEADEEILQDFLVEAGELLEQLSEQLVDLENQPEDVDLLNAIFRGFHTVKGGAGFLQLDPLVDLCHIAENVFDFLRNGKLSVNSELMDVVLEALDSVNEMFATINNREMPPPAEPALLASLQRLADLASDPNAQESTQESPAEEAPIAASTEVAPAEVPGETQPAKGGPDISDEQFEEFLEALDDPLEKTEEKTEEKNQAPANSGEITDDEFDRLMDELHGEGKGPTLSTSTPLAANAAGSKKDEITEDEFDSLLDELHGAGKSPAPNVGGSSKNQTKPASSSGSGDEIKDDEFEALLDELHGEGKGPTVVSSDSVPIKPASPEAAAPVAKTQPASAASSAKKADPMPAPKKPAAAKPPAKPPAKDSVPAETTVRVDTKRLDDIMNMVGELVLVRNRLVRLGLKTVDEAMSQAVANLDVVTADLQTSVMKTRMQPIKKVFGRFPRVVRDLARTLKKEINLELQGEDTDLDKNLVEALADPLVHLVRNSVDHGIESPDEREKSGKIRSGTIILAAQQEGDHIVLSISDDGGGMNPNMLRSKAVQKGMMDEESAERLSDQEAFNLIFHPGFSTRDQISDVSGRGVGMDVVKTKITQLNGTLDINSKEGEGTVIAIKVPLTLAIMPTLMVMLGTQTFALPLVSVNEIFHMDLSRTNVVDGQEVVIVREKALPLFHLKGWLVAAKDNHDSSSSHVVIVSVGTQKVGFVVDQLIGQEEVVIKPLGKMLHGTAGMAGATITGDGRIALILDVPSMLKRYAGKY